MKDAKQLLWNVGATFGRPNGDLPLSDIGKIVDNELIGLSSIYESVSVEKSVIMPNHIHMIILISRNNGGRPKDAPTVSQIVKQFKGVISKELGYSVWQKSFYEHIIRNEQDFLEVWYYIEANPQKWAGDKYNNEWQGSLRHA